MKNGNRNKNQRNRFDLAADIAQEFELVNWTPWGDDKSIPIDDQRTYAIIGVKNFPGEIFADDILAISDEFGRQFIIGSEGVKELATDN